MTDEGALFLICWAIIGGIGASRFLPAMRSLIHGNYATGGCSYSLPEQSTSDHL